MFFFRERSKFMDRKIRRLTTAAVAGVVLIGAGAVCAAEPSVEDLKARVQELSDKVTAMEAKQQSASDATIEAVLRDAEQRSKLLAVGAGSEAGWDNGFVIRSGDAFVLRPGVFFQFRNVLNYREDTGGAKSDEIENGFEVRRARIKMQGNVLSKDLEYSFVWESNREGGGTTLLDAWVKYMFNDQWGIRAGQFKEPLSHEKLVSSERQLAAERSIVDSSMGGDLFNRVQGVTAIYGNYAANNPLYAEFGITDGGPASMNTNFTKHTFDWGVAGRVEYKLMGDWSAYRDFTAKDTKKDLLVVGGGVDWSQAGNGNLLHATADVQWEGTAGLGAYGAILFQNADDTFTGLADDTTNIGLVAQVGYLIDPLWEVFGRFDVAILDNDVVFPSGDTEDTFYEITLGFNRYLGPNGSWKHNAKFTVDIGFLPNGAPSAFTGQGVLDANDGGFELVVRSQFQLVL
jgi:hypothetical protein